MMRSSMAVMAFAALLAGCMNSETEPVETAEAVAAPVGAGASVDLSDCSVSAEAGDPELRVRWSDPEFDASQRAAYYVRVLENPTCRWSTWDALKTGAERNPRLPAAIQERAWTSPIWIAPTR